MEERIILSKGNLKLFVHTVAKHVAVASVILLFRPNLLAQDFELIKIQSAYYMPQTVEKSSIDGQIGFYEWGAQIAIPHIFKKSKKTILIHSLAYSNLSVNAEAKLLPQMGESKSEYHTISYNFGLVQTLNSNWLLVVNFIPTLASDIKENLSGDDLLYQANGLVIKTKNKKLMYGFGMSYTTRLGRQLFIPLGLMKYNTRKLDFNLVLPNKLDFMFKTPKNILSFGLKAGLNGGVFNNTTDFQSVSNVIDKVGYRRLVIGPAITLRLRNTININLIGGMALGRRLELVDINNDVIDRTPQAGPFFSVGLSFVPKNKTTNAGLNF